MVYAERITNLFNVDNKYYLAHCISSDYKMGRGIAIEFENKFKLKEEFKIIEHESIIKVGDAILIGKVFNLITKPKYNDKPTYATLRRSLEKMKKICEFEDIKYLAMPKIGCGLDRLSWDLVSDMIQYIFKDLDIEILICIK